jgi:hypothetical protein
MIKKIIAISLFASILSGCITGPEGYLKRSANNKLFDTKGFRGGKRAPLYNKKYISQAKKNVVNEDYELDIDDDSDDDYEQENIARENIEMYREMLEREMAEQNKNRKKSRVRSKKNSYPSTKEISPCGLSEDNSNNLELKNELEKIKAMLNETKNELANTRCPSATEIEKENNKDHSPTPSSTAKPKTSTNKPQYL